MPGDGSEVVAHSVQVKAANGTETATKTGAVTINPVSLSIGVKGATFQYDGNPHELSELEGYPEACYELGEDTSLVAGQTPSITGTLAKYMPGAGVAAQEKVSDVGTYMGGVFGDFGITDQSGRSTLLNYLMSTSVEMLVIECDEVVATIRLVSGGENPVAGSWLEYKITVSNYTADAQGVTLTGNNAAVQFVAQ